MWSFPIWVFRILINAAPNRIEKIASALQRRPGRDSEHAIALEHFAERELHHIGIQEFFFVSPASIVAVVEVDDARQDSVALRARQTPLLRGREIGRGIGVGRRTFERFLQYDSHGFRLDIAASL